MAKKVEEVIGDVFFQRLVEHSIEILQDDQPRAKLYAVLSVALAIKDVAEAIRDVAEDIRNNEK